METLQQAIHDSPEDAERFINLTAKHVDRLNAIIEDLTSLSRIEQDEHKEDLAFERCVLRTILDNAVQVCESAAEQKSIRVEVTCANEVYVKANAALLEQCFVNLVDNAIKYSPAQSRVRVEAEANGTRAYVRVIDEGVGIPREHHERVFERFYQVNKARSREAGGTGLGLAIVRHIVQAHRGTVDLESQPGTGSTFRVALPLNGS